MEIYFLNSDFEDIYLLDSFKSLIWTDRYWQCGDLDIVLPPKESVLDILPDTEYFRIEESEHNMLLDSYGIESDLEKGDELVIQGRSLESILDRRIIWDGLNLSGNLQTEVQRILTDNVIDPSNTDRDLPFVFLTNSLASITGLTIDSQFCGELVYDAICDICKANEIGFEVYYVEATQLFSFKLYAGLDRSYDQSDNTSVAFTTALENLVNANYIDTKKHLKTVCLVAGEEGVGNVRTTVTVSAPGGALTRLNRRELYLESSVNRTTPDGDLTEAEYLLQLEGKGRENLAKKVHVQVFDGEVDTTMYDYGDEFYMGDIIQIADEYGHQTKSRVVEMIYSQNKEGIKIYPTFQTVE